MRNHGKLRWNELFQRRVVCPRCDCEACPYLTYLIARLSDEGKRFVWLCDCYGYQKTYEVGKEK